MLEAGGVVIAAPYVETAVAFGAACGLAEEWIRELLRFAPQARPPRAARRSASSIAAGSAVSIAAIRSTARRCSKRAAPKLASKRARRETMALLDRRAAARCSDLTEKGVAAIS